MVTLTKTQQVNLERIRYYAELHNYHLRYLIFDLMKIGIPEDLASDYVYEVIDLDRLLEELEKERADEKIKADSGQ